MFDAICERDAPIRDAEDERRERLRIDSHRRPQGIGQSFNRRERGALPG